MGLYKAQHKRDWGEATSHRHRVSPLFTLWKAAAGFTELMVAWLFPLSQYYRWSSKLTKSNGTHTGAFRRQKHCHSSLKLTLPRMHFSMSSKGARTTKLLSQPSCTLLCFQKWPPFLCAQNVPFIPCLVIEEAFWWGGGEHSHTVTVSHPTWSQTDFWITLNCSGVIYFLCGSST